MTDIFKQALELTEQAVKDQVATSDTPRTDFVWERRASCFVYAAEDVEALLRLARQLERELSAAQSATAPLLDLISRLEAWADENTPADLLAEARAALDRTTKT